MAGITDDGAAYIIQRPSAGVPAGSPVSGGVARTNDGAVYVTGSVGPAQNAERTLVIAGDSLTERNKFTDGTTYVTVLSKGWFPMTATLLGWPWRLLNVSATGGDKIADLAGDLQTGVLNYQPDDCIVMIGVNDAHAWTAASDGETAWDSYLSTIIEPLLGSGIRPIICTILPSNNIDTAAKQQGWFLFNSLMRDYASQSGKVRLVDLAAMTYSDPATGYGALTAYLDDAAVHPNTAGANLIARAFETALVDMKMPRKRFGVVTGDPYNGATSAGWVFDTGAAAGSKSGTPTPSGSVATSWTVAGTCTNSTGTTVVCSLQASADGGNDWQRIVLAGSGMSGQTNCSFQLQGANLTLSGSQFAVGDWVELRAEVRITAGHTALLGIEPSLNFVSATQAQWYCPRSLNSAGYEAGADDLSGALAVGTYMTQIPTGTTAIKAILAVKFQTAVAAAGATIEFRDVMIRKVTPPTGFDPDYLL